MSYITYNALRCIDTELSLGFVLLKAQNVDSMRISTQIKGTSLIQNTIILPSIYPLINAC